MDAWSYLLINAGSIAVPLLVSAHPKLRFYREWRRILRGLAAMGILFLPWDIWFTHLGVWGFNENYLLGTHVFGLPIEEWLFFICIPFACLLIMHCFDIMAPRASLPLPRGLLYGLSAALLILGLYHYDKAYTLSACVVGSGVLFYAIRQMGSPFLGRFFLHFLITLIPFAIVNGILTGISFWHYPLINPHPEAIADMIVWYAPEENMGVRIFSIPVEDAIYAFGMLLLVRVGYGSGSLSGS